MATSRDSPSRLDECNAAAELQDQSNENTDYEGHRPCISKVSRSLGSGVLAFPPAGVPLSAGLIAFVGANASGKTEILQAFVQLFGARTPSIA